MVTSPSLRLAEKVVFALLATWLFVAAMVVDIEYYDGLDSVLNARFFTGQAPTYEATRGPLLGFLLIPAEWARLALDLHPLDTRPHHVVSALLHLAYLLGSYALLVRCMGRGWMTWLAWLAAVPNFLFFSYGPYVSHDILPGVLFLALLLGADRFMRAPQRALWAALLVVGAAAVCIKHTYALFWIIALALQLAWVLFAPHAPRRELFRRWVALVAAAAGGALILWFALCQSMGSLFPETPYLFRAWEQLKYLLFQAHDQTHPEHVWVYLRNFPAFGMLAMIFALPGVWLSLKGNRTQRMLAFAWLLAVLALHLLSLRQVRYLSFIAPVTAALLIPVLGRMWQLKWGRRVVVGLLVWNVLPLHAYSIAGEALRIREPFYRRSPIRDMLSHLESPGGGLRKPVCINWDKLSFAPMRTSPFAGDIYHDLYHLGQHHLRQFYGLTDPLDILMMTLPQMQAQTDWDKNSVYIASTDQILINPSTWDRKPPPSKITLQQMVFVAEDMDIVQPEEGVYAYAAQGKIDFSFELVKGQTAVTFRNAALASATEECLAFHARVPGSDISYPMNRDEDGTISVVGLEKKDLGEFGAPYALRLRTLKRVHHHFHRVREVIQR